MRYVPISVACLGVAAAAAFADNPPVPALPLSELIDAAQSTLAACKRDGYNIAVTILDADLSTRIVLRANGAPDEAVKYGYRKAYTAGKTGMSTRDFGKTVPNGTHLDPKPGSVRSPPPGPINGDSNLITWPGGFPIVVAGKLVGAISSAGAPRSETDEACVRAGLARIPGADQ